MNTKTNIYSSLAGLALVGILLTGCSTTSAQPSATPSAAASTAAAPAPSATATVADTDSAIPAVVSAAYSPAVTANLVADGDAISELLYGGGLADLYGVRTADEALLWSPVTDVMTSGARDRLLADLASSDPATLSAGLILAQATTRDGVVATIGGVTYHAATNGDTSPVQMGTRVSTAGIGLDDAGAVTYTTDWNLRAHTIEGPTVRVSVRMTLHLVPSTDGHWLVDGWYGAGLSPITAGE